MAFFALRDGGLVDPAGRPFLTLAVNHADETNLKYPHNIDVWRSRYGCREKWLADGVLKDFRDWGFTTVGWTQEWVSGQPGQMGDWSLDLDLRHSEPWAAGELYRSGMPYVAQMRPQEMEDWNGFPVFRDLDRHFESWCDYLARKVVTEHADSENLLGYFLADIPAWTPPLGRTTGRVLGSVGPTELYDLASRFYETITGAIRRVDPHHLILGDRYNGNKAIPEPVLRAMAPFGDVLSVQYFIEPTADARQKMIDDLVRWREMCGGKPVLVADIGNWTPTARNPGRVSLPDQAGRGQDYGETLATLLAQPWFVGWHWCSYLENDVRGWGLKDPWDEPYRELTDAVTVHNRTAVTSRGMVPA